MKKPMTKAQIKRETKRDIKQAIKKYGCSLSQVMKAMKEQNPEWEILLNEVELELTTDQLMGRL